MAKGPQREVKDEPGADRRFMRGIKKALSTPPKPFTPKKKGAWPDRSKGTDDGSR